MNRLQHLYSTILIIILSAAIYANALKNGFVYDDRAFTIIPNAAVLKELHNLPKLFTEEYFGISGEKTYRPVVTFTYFIDYALFGLKPWGYHLTNLLLHAANGVCLYVFATLLNLHGVGNARPVQTYLSPHIPLLVSLLFVTHPVLTEAVNCISYREDLLAFLFYIATLIIYMALNPRRRPMIVGFLYLLSCVAYSLALFSKEIAVTLPAIVYCYEYIYASKKGKGVLSILPNRYNIGYIVITLVYIYYKPVSGGSVLNGLIERGASIPWLILSYAKLLLFPIILSADYAIVPVNSYSSPSFILSFLAVVSLSAAIFMMRKREKGVSFGALFFVITLVPVYNIVSMDNFIAERYLYLPAAGFALVAGTVIPSIISNLKSKFLYLLITVFTIAGLYSFAVIRRNGVWENEYSLWSDTVRKMPESARAHFGMGYSLFERGRIEEAIREYKNAIKLAPTYAHAYNNLGYLYAYQDRFEEAIPHLETVLRLKPRHSEAHDNLGKIYTIQGRLDEAVWHFNEALNVTANDPAIHTNLGFAYYRQGKIEEALQQYRISLELNQNNPKARNNTGVIYSDQGRLDEAIDEFRTALELSPELTDAHYNLGIAYLKKGLKEEARAEFEITLRQQPDHLEVQWFLKSLN